MSATRFNRPPIRKHGSELVKNYHKSIVFNLIRTKGPISRAELARVTKMSATSIGRIVGDLIDENLVNEVGQTSSGLGRRATLLAMNADGALAVGVDIDTAGITAGMVNLAGLPVSKIHSSPLPEGDPDGAIAQVKDLIDAVLESESAKQDARLLGIGVTIPGAVTWPGGHVRLSPQLDWSDVSLRSTLERRVGWPVLAENNVKASAVAESLFGVAQGVSDFVIVTLGSGMGAAVVAGGELYRGPDNIAGEIGHTTVDPQGPLCACGRRGCLATYTSIFGIERVSGRKFEEVLSLAQKGDSASIAVLDKTIDYLAMALSNLTCTYNPDFVVIDGRYFLKAWPDVVQKTQEKVLEFLWKPVVDDIRILPTAIADNSTVISSAAIVMQEFLMNPITIRETLM